VLGCWYKRIERGRLRLPRDVERVPHVVLDSGQLLLLIEGIDWSRVRRLPDWQRASTIDNAAAT
jgi:transposase